MADFGGGSTKTRNMHPKVGIPKCEGDATFLQEPSTVISLQRAV